MKKLFLVAVLAVCSVFSMNAQEVTFGALGGLSIMSMTVEGGGFEVSDSETGFMVGLFADLGISESFGVQPELTYSIAGDVSLIGINAIAKYNVSEEFNIQAGPQFAMSGGDAIDALEDAIGEDDFNKLNIQVAIGAGYDISEELFVQARYGFQVNDYFTGDGDGGLTLNTINLSLGYRF